MRVMPRSWPRSSSGADITSALIICSATFRAATAVDPVFCSILRASTMPSRLFGATVLAPVNAASAAISASMKSSLPRFLRTVLSGKAASGTANPFPARCRVRPLPYGPEHSAPTLSTSPSDLAHDSSRLWPCLVAGKHSSPTGVPCQSTAAATCVSLCVSTPTTTCPRFGLCMPGSLGVRFALRALDAAVEAAYGVDFKGDEEKIVAHLFKLYAEKTGRAE